VFPFIYEYQWTPTHMIFLGTFFSVVLVIVATVSLALVRAYTAFRKRHHEAIQWEADFEDLPIAARVCRHQITGEVTERTCHSAFDCRSCAVHPTFLAHRAPTLSPAGTEESMFGVAMPLDRYYHRGHAWVKYEGDGMYTIGLDDFGSRMIGTPDAVELPAVGASLAANGNGWLLRKGVASLRILSPIDGVVIRTGSVQHGWFLKVRSGEPGVGTRHLLRGEEVRPWVMRELDRLQLAVTSDGIGMSLADGGELVPDMWKQAPQVDWDGVWGQMFLQA
jgi:glycine cleavage system H lipoate-binding protein